MVARVGLGGGCHWCTEAVFQALRGVVQVAQGFIRATPPDDAFSEAVLVDFDPARITLDELIEIHLHTHACTSQHRLRGKYRSAVYVVSPAQAEAAAHSLGRCQRQFDEALVTQVLTFDGFRSSEPRFLNYFSAHPDKPFSVRYIQPKLARMRADYAMLMR